MGYFREFRLNWTTLLGAMLGVALGSGMNYYMANLFAPELIKEFGWERSQFALSGTLGLASMFFIPLWGRFADKYGPHLAILIGYVVMILSFIACSMMTGNIYEYFAISLMQSICGVLTTSLVFTRVIIARFDLGRGMALACLMSGPPLIGAIAVPLVGEIVTSYGWRSGYLTLAALCVFGCIASLALIGRAPKNKNGSETPDARKANSITLAQLGTLLKRPSFVLIVLGMFFVNVPSILVSSQLKMVLQDSGAPATLATWLISLYAIGVVCGRFMCGLALDRISPQVVALVALGLPAVGFLILASPSEHPWMLTVAIMLIGLAQGAEGDVGAYLTSRTFEITNFSLIYSFVVASIGIGAAVGSLVLSVTLKSTDTFDAFLLISAVVTIIGALCFFMTGRGNKTEIASDSPEMSPATT